MAASQTSIFQMEDRHIIRLRKMNDLCIAKAFLKLLYWLTPHWIRPSPFLDHLSTIKPGFNNKFKSSLKPSQKDVMKRDPIGTSYDVSLLFLLIQWGNEFLADKDDAKWKAKDGCLESLITSVKDIRNSLMHCYESIDQREFFRRTQQLRDILEKMITGAAAVCRHISKKEVKKTLKEIIRMINRIRDDPLDPKNFNDYRSQLLFSQQRTYVQNDGKMSLRRLHLTFSSVTPATHLATFSFDVGKIFTDMLLKGGDNQMTRVELEDILDGDSHMVTRDIILVEGGAGIGKTTLTKKLLSDWIHGTGNIKHLDDFDLLFHVECRDQIRSFRGLLSSSMAEVAKSFQGQDLELVTLDLQCLIIVDGFDEINQTTAQLFQEILTKKKMHDISVLVTTRPEAVDKYFQLTRSHPVKTKHIVLEGIPKQNVPSFVQGYYNEFTSKDKSEEGVAGLLRYLNRTEAQLSYLWRVPYNLTLITILWRNYPDVVKGITTAPELHWQIHQMYISKLLERLLSNKATKHLSLATLKWKISLFIQSLCWQSLVSLINNDITLTPTSYQELENTCHQIEIPAEEMLGAFLKKTTSSSGIRYSFPHKGTLDFMTAHYFWIQITGVPRSYDLQKITKGFGEVLVNNTVPAPVSQNILRLAEGELTKKCSQSTASAAASVDINKAKKVVESSLTAINVPEEWRQDISRLVSERLSRLSQTAASSASAASQPQESNVLKNILKEAHGSSKIEISKFQNPLTHLVGMFYLESNKIDISIKMEALKLLQETGIRDSKDWIQLLSGVKCDKNVAAFISKQPCILEGDIIVDESSVSAYISLLAALERPFSNSQQVNFMIDIKEDVPGELITLILKNSFNVSRLTIENAFRNPTKMASKYVAEIFQRCQVTHYEGALTPDLHLPLKIEELHVSVADEESYDHLRKFLSQPGIRLKWLGVCVGKDLDPTMVSVMPYVGRGLEYTSLYIPDLKNHKGISDIISLFKPIKGRFGVIVFPRISIASGDLWKLLEEMRGGQVRDFDLVFPSSLLPSRKEEIDHLRETAERTLNCSINWGGYDIDEW